VQIGERLGAASADRQIPVEQGLQPVAYLGVGPQGEKDPAPRL
jgi:hypothetical protein